MVDAKKTYAAPRLQELGTAEEVLHSDASAEIKQAVQNLKDDSENLRVT